MLAPRKGVRQMGSGPVGWGRGGGEETEGREMGAMRMKVSIRDWDQQMPPLIYSKDQ